MGTWIKHSSDFIGTSDFEIVLDADSLRRPYTISAVSGDCELIIGDSTSTASIILKEGETRTDLPPKQRVLFKGLASKLVIITEEKYGPGNYHYRLDGHILMWGDQALNSPTP